MMTIAPTNQPTERESKKMTTTTKAQNEQEKALEILGNLRDTLSAKNAFLVISQQLGKGDTDYLRVATPRTDNYSGFGYLSDLTWFIGKAFGYRLTEKGGRWFLAVNGGGFSKPNQIARTLANFYGIERVRYEVM
jgi:hypothetical protein